MSIFFLLYRLSFNSLDFFSLFCPAEAVLVNVIILVFFLLLRVESKKSVSQINIMQFSKYFLLVILQLQIVLVFNPCGIYFSIWCQIMAQFHCAFG